VCVAARPAGPAIACEVTGPPALGQQVQVLHDEHPGYTYSSISVDLLTPGLPVQQLPVQRNKCAADSRPVRARSPGRRSHRSSPGVTAHHR
jgi:hypothetical protein